MSLTRRSVHGGRRVFQVPASVPLYPTDCTSAFNSWLANVPDHCEVRFAPGANYAYGDTGYGANYPGAFNASQRNDIIFNGQGCTFTAITNDPTRPSIWTFFGSTNCVLENCTMNGPRGSFSPPAGNNEAKVGIDLGTASGFRASGVSINNIWGYFVFTHTDNGGPSGTGAATNCVFDGCHFANNGDGSNPAQGLALVATDGFTFQNGSITGVDGANAVDVEPNFTFELARNVTIKANTLGYFAGALSVEGATTPTSCSNIIFSGNVCQKTSWQCPGQFTLSPRVNGITGVQIINNTVNGLTNPNRGSAGATVSVSGFPGIVVNGNSFTRIGGGGCGGQEAMVEISNSPGFVCQNNTAVVIGAPPLTGVYGTGNGTWTVGNNTNFPPDNIDGGTPNWQAGVTYDLYGPVVRTDLFVGLNYGAHEAPMNTNPGFDWTEGARPGGNGLPGSNVQCAFWWAQALDATTAYSGGSGGQAAQQAPNTKVRIQWRYAEQWSTLTPTGAWSLTTQVPGGTGTQVGGLFSFDTFSSNGTFGPQTDDGQAADGTHLWSFPFIPGHINHWWDSRFPRVANVSSATQIFHARVQVRLIPDTAAGGTATDVANAKIIGANGMDWYATPNSTSTGLPGIGEARHRFITANWQWFTNTWSMSQSQLAANPPPVPTQSLT